LSNISASVLDFKRRKPSRLNQLVTLLAQYLAVLNESLKEPISRASIINSLNAMVDEGILGFTEVTGKGGHHQIYSLNKTESQLKQHLAWGFIDKLLAEYPTETRKSIKQF
jgi:hypothetical protein